MSLSTVVMRDDTVWRETWLPGESWWHDKTRWDLLGFIDDRVTPGKFAVVKCSAYYDEDSDEFVENNQVVAEYQAKDDAIQQIKEYFGVQKISNAKNGLL